MEYKIEPYIGVGPVRFGMTIEEVRSALSGKARPSHRTLVEDPLKDAFDEVGMDALYDVAGTCQVLNFGLPARPTLLGQPLLGRPFREMLEWFASIDPAVEVNDESLISHRFGVSLYAEIAIYEPDTPTEVVVVFSRGSSEDKPSSMARTPEEVRKLWRWNEEFLARPLLVEPLVGVGPIRFGMTREEVRKAVGSVEPPHEDEKPPYSRPPLTCFNFIGITAIYKAEGACYGVILQEPSRPTLQGRSLLGRPFRQVEGWLREIDPDLQVKGSYLISQKLGIKVLASGTETRPDEPTSEVLVVDRSDFNLRECTMWGTIPRKTCLLFEIFR